MKDNNTRKQRPEDVILDAEILGPEDDTGQDYKAGGDAHEKQTRGNTAGEQTEYNGETIYGVPNYQTTDDATRARMDDIIATIDPYDTATIRALASEELKRVGQIAEEVQACLDEEGDVLNAMEQIGDKLSSFDISALMGKAANTGLSTIQWARKNPGTAVTAALSTVALGPVALIGVPVAKRAFDKVKAKKTGADLADHLRKSVQQTTEVIAALEDADEKIPLMVEQLNKLGKTRVENYKELSVYIGAALEKLRRIDQEDLPELEAEVADNQRDPDLQLQLENLKLGKNRLDRKITTLVSSRTVSEISAATLARLKSVYYEAHGQVETHLEASVPQWKLQIAESGLAIHADKVGEVLGQANELGAKILQQQVAVSNRTSAMIQDSARKGTYDPAKLIGVMKDMETALEKDVRTIADMRKSTQEDRQKLSAATERFYEKRADLARQGLIALPGVNDQGEQPKALPGTSTPRPN